MVHDPVFEVRRAVSATGRLHQPGDRILIGVSGGADSLALAAAAAADTESGLQFGAVVIDHMLQEGSATVAASTAETCRSLGLDPVFEVHVNVNEDLGGLENAARLARRIALLNAAEEIDAAAIWLAHTSDDQAETVLLGLLRGSGPRSLAGMRMYDGVCVVVGILVAVGTIASAKTGVAAAASVLKLALAKFAAAEGDSVIDPRPALSRSPAVLLANCSVMLLLAASCAIQSPACSAGIAAFAVN